MLTPTKRGSARGCFKSAGKPSKVHVSIRGNAVNFFSKAFLVFMIAKRPHCGANGHAVRQIRWCVTPANKNTSTRGHWKTPYIHDLSRVCPRRAGQHTASTPRAHHSFLRVCAFSRNDILLYMPTFFYTSRVCQSRVWAGELCCVSFKRTGKLFPEFFGVVPGLRWCVLVRLCASILRSW